MLDPGVVIASRYLLSRPLARGGMGSVWVARHLHLDVDVAIKFMSPEHAASAEGRARFEREARAAARIRSPHVVQVHDYGIDREAPYLVMELLEGEDLERRLRRVGRLPLPETRILLDQICRALARAHEAGLVHRDLKPANVFLARRGGEETVKLLDFGIAKSLSPSAGDHATKTGTLIGSPHYMSPEQTRRSKLVDHRSDLWAAGVIVYRCATGRLPFSGDEMIGVLVAICTEPVPPPSHVAPDLPPALDPFIARALAHDAGQRFQTANELADAFARIVDPGHDGGPWRGPGHDGVPCRGPEAHPLAPSEVTMPPASGIPASRSVPGVPPVPTGTLAPTDTSLGASSAGAGRGVKLVAAATVTAVLAAAVTTHLLLLRASSGGQRPAAVSADPSIPGSAPSAPLPAITSPPPPAPSVVAAPVHAGGDPQTPATGVVVETAAPASPPSSLPGAGRPPGRARPPRGSPRRAIDPLDSR